MVAKKEQSKEEVFPSEGLKAVEQLVTPSGYTDIKFILRTIGAVPSGSGLITVEQAENYVGSFLKEGWSIYSFDVLESLPEGRRVAWLLVK